MASPPSAETPQGRPLATTSLPAPAERSSDLPATTALTAPRLVPLPDQNLAPTPLASRTFGKYELLEVLAQGGMGTVYKAEDTSLRRTVALKMIRSGFLASADEVRRFRQEAQAPAPLSHPHVIPIYEIGEQDGYHYFTMPLAAGGNLAGRLHSLRDQPPAAVALLEKIARAVHAAHAHGILHRDLKPANVLLDEHGEPLIADFGLAKLLDGSPGLTDPGQVVGTPSYLSPEQAAGRNDLFSPATDVWALGVILCEMLTGRLPFTADDRGELLRRILTAEPPRPRDLRPGLDRGLEAIILKCLRKDPSRRYASAEALADDLCRWLAGKPVADDASVVLKARSRTRRRLVLVVLGLLLVAALIFTAGRFPEGDTPTAPPAAKETSPKPSTPPTPPRVLIGATGPPPQSRWLLGGANATVVSRADEAFSFHVKGFAALELLEAPPGPRYRLEAEVRHDESWTKIMPAVGLFFAHRNYADGTDEFLGFFQASFADAPNSGPMKLFFRTYQRSQALEPYMQGMSPPLPLTPDGRLGSPFPWRQIAVEVTPEEVRLFQGEQRLHQFTLAALQAKPRPRIAGRLVEVGPKLEAGGLGLVLYQGRGSFRNVVIKPLP
jgi:serine/threonine-protein kinase